MKNHWKNISNAIWVVTPSIIFSLAFKGFFICVDPFFFPLLDRYANRTFARGAKLIWLAAFAMSVLLGWNIPPKSYYFFISEALFYSPATIMLEVVAFLGVLGLLAFNIPNNSAGRKFSAALFLLGSVCVLAKLPWLRVEGMQESMQISVRSSVAINLRFASENLFSKRGNKIGAASVERSYFSRMKSEPAPAVNEIMMLVESWGEKSETLNSMVAEISRTQLRVAQYGFVPYGGSTLNAEFRELCSKNVTLTEKISHSESPLLCAPNYLKAKGYRIFGFHGYSGRFYARNIMWQSFGIDSRNFLDKMEGDANCRGVFVGACDPALIKMGLDRFNDKTPTFVYFLTLTSHEPVWKSLVKHDAQYFGAIPTVADAQILARSAISSLVTQVLEKQFHACTSIYIVGDHQPPSMAEQGVFDKNQVPFMRLQLNCNAGGASTKAQ